jgi:hypothetical protein
MRATNSAHLTLFTFLIWLQGPFSLALVSLLGFLWSHIQTHGRTPLDEGSARRRDLYLHRTTQHINTRDKHPCPERNSNPRFQQPSRRRPTPACLYLHALRTPSSSFGVKRDADHSLHLVARSRMCRSYLLSPFGAFVDSFSG